MYQEGVNRVNAWVYDPNTLDCRCLLIRKFIIKSDLSKEKTDKPVIYVKKEDITKILPTSTVDIQTVTPESR